MAEAVLFDVAGQILGALGSQVFQEIKLLRGVNDELDKLQVTVSTLQAVLLDAEKQYAANHQVRDWLRQLKEPLYAADDLLDDFSTEVLRRRVMTGSNFTKEVGLFFSSSNQLFYRLKMAHRIRDVRAKLDHIAASRKFHLEECPFEIQQDRQTHSYPPQTVVGREVDKEAIIDLLLSSNNEENPGIIPIVGLGGSGKTTLAQLVFNDSKVISQFDLRLWVCVADNFDLKLLVGKILGSETRRTSEDAELNDLVGQLHERIDGKRYLLVLDDVWNEVESKWSRFIDLLTSGARGSRIIVTTRDNKVAYTTRPIKVHELRGLSSDESWTLFSQVAFRKGQDLSDTHIEIGKEIVAKCMGLPLAIKVIGGLLYFKTTISEWISFRSKELLSLEEGDSSILKILKLSYDHLPSHLKHCFAYCCIFPKDHIIDVPKLINLWMAQGYVYRSNPYQCLEDIGLEYFNNLLWGSFFQEVIKDDCGNINSCKMHDLMHDLATEVAGSESKTYDSIREVIDKNVHHISFYFDDDIVWKIPVARVHADNVRTFLLLHDEFVWKKNMDKRQWGVFLCRFRNLRSLDLHNSYIKKIPHSINKLKHLRYLDLSFNKSIEILPNSIIGLCNLLVLRLKGCSSLRQLPKNIHQLINLSQLDLADCWDLKYMPRGLEHLTSLHTLTKFVVARTRHISKHAASIKELHGMNNLRGALEISNLKDATLDDLRVANLKRKEYLEILTLDWYETGKFGDEGGMTLKMDENEVTMAFKVDENEATMALEVLEPYGKLKMLRVRFYHGLKIPKWISSLTNLVEFELKLCGPCQYIPPLHQLPCLQRLVVYGLMTLEYMDSEDSVEATSPFFPSLKTLELVGCPNLKGWWRRPQNTTLQLLPMLDLLSHLVIYCCPNLASMPLFPPLKYLDFGGGSLQTLKDILKATVTAEHITSSPPSDASSSSSFSITFSQLQQFSITDIEDLELLPQELLCSMCSLKVLSIRDCPRLKAMGPALRHLTSLESLDIRGCTELNLLEEEQDDHWQALGCLRSLSLVDIPKLESLPKWLQHSQSLHILDLTRCDNLKSMPDWMPRLTSLQRLFILFCGQLSDRCGGNKGEDWPCISHIPNIIVDAQWVQKNGRNLL